MLGEQPPVRLNQLGFLADAPKRATLVTEREEPIAFRVLASSGEMLADGRSQAWRQRPEGPSGLAVHVLDFSALAAAGSGLRVEIAAILAGDPSTDTLRAPDWVGDPDISAATYVWLPIRFDGELPYADWSDRWRIEDHS